jgi:hypothetical protein
MMGLNVRDFGAVGDGKADDTAALQRALDAARIPIKPTGVGPALVVLPPGHYRVTEPLKMDHSHGLIVIRGTGGVDTFGANPIDPKRRRRPRAATQIVWDGPEGGTLFDIWGAGGLQMHDLGLIGSGKAGVLISVNSPRAHGAGRYTFERMTLVGAEVGFETGNDSHINSADMTFLDVHFVRLKTGFRTMSVQNVDFTFIRPRVIGCELGLHFHKGGNAEANSLFGIGVKEVVRIDSGGINAGTFFFSNMRIDVNYSFKDPETGIAPRSIILRAKGETNVKFSALDVICGNAMRGDRTPAFILGPHANVSVASSIISGKVAELTGNPDAPPTWIQFDNCRFRVFSDPREIEHDAASGFELRNCVIVEDEKVDGKYVQKRNVFVPHFAKYPSQAGEE